MLIDKTKAADTQDPFVPYMTLERALRYWWLVAALMVFGGLGGWLFSLLKPAQYEAAAQFSVSVDFVSTGPLTQYEEDLAINTAGHVFDSSDLLKSVVAQANSEGIPVTLDVLLDQFTLERKFSLWTLRVRNTDPAVAERLAQIWLEKGQTVLLQSYEHAIQAYALEQYIRRQENCLVEVSASEPSLTTAQCPAFAEIQKNLRQAAEALYQEKLASRSLYTGITIGPFNPPVVSQKPVEGGRNQSVLLGALLGFAASIAWIEFGRKQLPRRQR